MDAIPRLRESMPVRFAVALLAIVALCLACSTITGYELRGAAATKQPDGELRYAVPGVKDADAEIAATRTNSTLHVSVVLTNRGLEPLSVEAGALQVEDDHGTPLPRGASYPPGNGGEAQELKPGETLRLIDAFRCGSRRPASIRIDLDATRAGVRAQLLSVTLHAT